jgi:predicted MFS family arabinose efflux permease
MNMSTQRAAPAERDPSAAAGKSQSAYVYYLIGLLLLVNILNFVDRQIPFILAESIKRDLGLSDTQLGVLGGIAFALVYSTLGIPLARLADRVGHTWVLAGSVFAWSALTACTGLAANFWQLVAARLGVAAGEAGSTPAGHALIGGYFEPERRGMPLAVFSLGVPIGSMLALMLGGWINEVASWRQAFAWIGVPGVVMAIVVAFTLREPRQPRVAAGAEVPLLKSMIKLWRTKTIRQMAIALAIYSMGANAMIVFTAPFLMRSHEMSSSSTGMSLGLLYGIAGVAGTLFGGLIGDWLGKHDARWRLWAPALALAGAAPFTLAAWFVPSAQMSVLLLAVPKFSNLLYIAPIFVALQSLVPAHMRATGSAFLLFFNSLVGVSIGPLVTGVVSDWLEPTFGQHALRYALCFVVLTQLWAAVHFFVAARTLESDRAAAAAAQSTDAESRH